MTPRISKSPVHGTAIVIGERGILLLGPAGSGKSGIALQMMALGAYFVADDQVVLVKDRGRVRMSAPAAICGQIEARFIGLLRTSSQTPACTAPGQEVDLHFAVNMGLEASARMPQSQQLDVLGCKIDLLHGKNVPNLASALMILGQNGRAQ